MHIVDANHAIYCRLDLIYSHVLFLFQLNELEIVEEKGRNQVDGSGGLYEHSNFLVKDLDGKHTLFFVETHPNCTQEEDVVLCAPLEESSYGNFFLVESSSSFPFLLGVSCANIYTSFPSHQQGHCFGCDDRAKELKHPSGGGYLGGLDEVILHFDDLDSDDDCFM
jgi:hypothetical protein